MEFARHSFTLAQRQSDGSTLRDHLVAIERATRQPQRELIAPPFPEAMGDVWAWFLRLDEQRQGNGFTMNKLSHADIGWYFHMRRIQPSEDQLDLIQKLDAVRMEYMPKPVEDSSSKTPAEKERTLGHSHSRH